MSRNRTYQSVIAVQTGGPDAVEPEKQDEVVAQASDAVARHMLDKMKLLHAVGVESDTDSIEDIFEVEPDRILMGFRWQGRHKRNLLQRLIWAARL